MATVNTSHDQAGTSDALRPLIDQWQQAMRRCDYLQAMREALPPSPAAGALDRQIAETQEEVQRLQQAVLEGP